MKHLLQNKVTAFGVYAIDAVYDFMRYLFYSGNLYGYTSSKHKLQTLILMYTHKVEKGLVISKQQTVFGQNSVTLLIHILKKYIRNGGKVEDPVFLSAHAALYTYKLHTSSVLQKQAPKTAVSLNNFLVEFTNLDIQSGGIKTFDYCTSAAKNKKIDFDFFVKTRHSIRHLTNRPVTHEVLEIAVDQARYTPSVCNRQAWRVHVFETAEGKKKALSHQNGNSGFGDTADKLLLITCDIRAFVTSRERNQYFIDGGMFSMSLIYALHAAGVGTCALNLSIYSHQDIKLHHDLKIPFYEAPIMMIAVGYPSDVLEIPYALRMPVSKIISYKNI